MNRGLAAWLAAIAALAVRGAARAEPPAESNYQVNATFSGGWSSLSNPAGTSGTQEAMAVGLIKFQAPLQDDESPYLLQPFMQRESTLTVSATIGRSDAADPSGEVYRTGWAAGASFAFDAYAKEWLALFAHATYAYVEFSDVDAVRAAHGFSTGAGVGFRHRNTRLDLSVGEQVVRSSGAFGPWQGNVTASAFTVIKRRLSLDVSGTLAKGGAQGFFEAELFPAKWTGVFVAASASRSDAYSDSIDVKQYSGSAGVDCWFDARSGMVGQYTLTYETYPGAPEMANGYHELSHVLMVEAYFRYR